MLIIVLKNARENILTQKSHTVIMDEQLRHFIFINNKLINN